MYYVKFWLCPIGCSCTGIWLQTTHTDFCDLTWSCASDKLDVQMSVRWKSIGFHFTALVVAKISCITVLKGIVLYWQPAIMANTGWLKKWHHFLHILTLPNINRFFKLFHCQNKEKICNNTITKDPTTPQVYCYTTLWNVKCLKSNNWKQDDFCNNTFHMLIN